MKIIFHDYRFLRKTQNNMNIIKNSFQACISKSNQVNIMYLLCPDWQLNGNYSKILDQASTKRFHEYRSTKKVARTVSGA